MILLRALMWALAAAIVAVSVVLWPDVPARIPTHFDALGRPDAWSDKSLALWLGLPALGLALAALMEWSTRQVLSRPESPLVNIPGKGDVLALPPAPRAEALGWMGVGLYVAGVATVAAPGLIQFDVWQTAHEGEGAGWTTPAALVLAAVVPVVAVLWASARTRAVVARERAR